jgi:hypothetical protein
MWADGHRKSGTFAELHPEGLLSHRHALYEVAPVHPAAGILT